MAKATAQPGLDQTKFEHLRDLCRRAGIKVTHQRLEVLRVLGEATDHPSAEDVYERLKPTLPTISLDTVYRTLTTLEAAGALVRLQLDVRARFDPDTEPHPHFVCRQCKSIQDLDWPGFARMALPPGAKRCGTVETRRLDLIGICRDCLKNADVRQ